MYTDMARRKTSDLELIRENFGNRETAILGAFVPNGVVFIPGGPVTIESESMLRWEVRWNSVSFKIPTRAMFDSFIQLWQEPGSNERIRKFAERWGPLAIQGDGTHLDMGNLERTSPEVSSGSDYLRAWKYLSRRAYSVLKIAAELEKGGRGKEPEWEVLSSPQEAGPSPNNVGAVSPFRLPNWARREFTLGAAGPAYGEPLPLERLKGIIGGEVSAWLERFGVKLSVKWSPRLNWQLQIFFSGWLLSAVALQLALAAMHADGLYVCSACDKLYPRSGKRPNAGEKNYCPDCGDKALENAEKNRRTRQAEARRLHAEGKTPAEIVAALKPRGGVASIKRWIGKGKKNGKTTR